MSAGNRTPEAFTGDPLPLHQGFPPADQTTHPTPQGAPESQQSPANRPAGHSPGPWRVAEKLSGSENHRGWGILRKLNGLNRAVGEVYPLGEDPTSEAEANARLIAAAPQLLDSLLAVEWGGSSDVGDPVDCCPNCLAPRGGHHYAHCELRDSLDAALGVTSPRVVHPAHAGRLS